MNTSAFPLLLTATLLATCLPGQAQTVNIQVEQAEDFAADWFSATDITYASGPDAGSSAFGGEGDMLCFNRARTNPVQGSGHIYEVMTTSYFFQGGGAVKGEGMVNWLVDNYYHPMVSTEDYSDRYPLHYALWEIAHDYDGTLASLDIYSGSNNLSGNRPDLDYLVADLIANHDSIDAGYRSSLYNINYLEDITPGGSPPEPNYYQSQLLVTPVPEPSGMLLIGMSGASILLRRRRAS